MGYNSLKHWGDIKLQTHYINNFYPSIAINNFPPYFLALITGAPLVSLFAFTQPGFTNLYWLAGSSSLIMLLRRYYQWNHPAQIIAFWLLYFLTHPEAKTFIQKRLVFLQVVFSICLIAVLPVTAD